MTDDFNKEEMDWIVAFRSVLKLMPETIVMYDLDGTTMACKKGVSSRVVGLPIAFMEEHFDILRELHEYHDKENEKMKHFEELERDIDNRDLPENIGAINKIHCSELITGKRIFWYYQEDLDFYKEGVGEERIKDYKWDLYSGIIVPRPGIESHYGEWDIEDIIIINDTAPSEKSYPEVFWITLGRLLNSDDLIEIFESSDINNTENPEYDNVDN